MLWAINCVDKPNAGELRDKFRTAHREYLANQKGVIVFSGAILTDDGNAAIGSLFVVNVGSRADAQAFSSNEPFTRNGVFANVTLARMRKGQLNPDVAEGA